MAVRILSRKGNGRKHVAKTEVEKLRLPEGLSEPSDSLFDYSILIYGKKKIGKTTLMAQAEGALFLMCEPGGKALRIRQVPVRSWSDFEGYIDLAIADPKVRVIVVDTADFSYEYCLADVCEKKVIDHPSDEEYGKGWNAVRAEYTRVIRKLLHSGKGVVFLSHSKDKTFKSRKSEEYSKVESSMPGQAKDILEGLVDIWANYDYDGKRRVLIIGGSDEVDAGHRVEGRFQYPNGEPITTIPMGRSPKEGFRNFVQAFGNHMPGQAEAKKKKLVLKK